MKTSVFITFCSLLVAGLVSLHFVFGSQFAGPVSEAGNSKKVDLLKRSHEEEKMKAELARADLADFQQEAATLLPQAGDKKSFALRQLASVVQEPSTTIQLERASTLFETAKTSFRRREFAQANSMFHKIVDQYPDSVHMPEAHFLMAEGYFQLHNFNSSAKEIEKLVANYPENELTGYAMLRLAKIFESEERNEDAADVYKSILIHFKDDQLIEQANRNLRSVQL